MKIWLASNECSVDRLIDELVNYSISTLPIYFLVNFH